MTIHRAAWRVYRPPFGQANNRPLKGRRNDCFEYRRNPTRVKGHGIAVPQSQGLTADTPSTTSGVATSAANGAALSSTDEKSGMTGTV